MLLFSAVRQGSTPSSILLLGVEAWAHQLLERNFAVAEASRAVDKHTRGGLSLLCRSPVSVTVVPGQW